MMIKKIIDISIFLISLPGVIVILLMISLIEIKNYYLKSD